MAGRRKLKKVRSSTWTCKNNQDVLTSIKDVTISEYANADKATHLKKCNAISREAARGDNGEEGAASEPEEGPERRGARRRGAAGRVASGREYPEVLFHLVSRFIAPEDVGRFAAVSRAAYAATRPASFWLRLYARHCAAGAASLPARLRVSPVAHHYALRCRVVCALHRLYQPFLARRRAPLSLEACMGRRCVGMWYERLGDRACLYYLKLKARWALPAAPPTAPHLLDRLCDVHAEPDADCLVLLVKCAKVSVVSEPPLGLEVRAVSGGGGGGADGCRLRRLRLDLAGASHTALVLDAVQETAVLRWWEAGYPAPPNPPRAAPRDEPLYADFLQHDIFS